MAFFLSTSDPGSPANQWGGASGAAAQINAALQTTLNQNKGFVNAFRNGSFASAQRPGVSVGAGNSLYTLDGWIVAPTGAAVPVAQDTATAAPFTGLKLSCASGITACALGQRISSEIMQGLLPLGGTPAPCTAQFLIYNNTSASITPQLQAGYASAKNNFGTVTSDLAAINLQPIAAGTSAVVALAWTPNANAANGYYVQLLLGGGLNHASGSVTVFAADCRSTPQATAGLVSAPPIPELRGYPEEMARNQAYYLDPAAGSGAAAYALRSYAAASGVKTLGVITFPPMRATPTAGATSSVSYTNCSLLTITPLSPNAFEVAVTVAAAGEVYVQFACPMIAEL